MLCSGHREWFPREGPRPPAWCGPCAIPQYAPLGVWSSSKNNFGAIYVWLFSVETKTPSFYRIWSLLHSFFDSLKQTKKKKKNSLTPQKEEKHKLKIVCGFGGWVFLLPFWMWAVSYITTCPLTYHAYSHATNMKNNKRDKELPQSPCRQKKDGRKNKREKLDCFKECGLWICNPEVRWILQSLKFMLNVLALENRNIKPTRFTLILWRKFYFLQPVSQDIRAQPVLHCNNKILFSVRWWSHGRFFYLKMPISKISVV